MPAPLRLTTGAKLPAIGLGLWKLSTDTAPSLVRESIRIGYRHLDSACDYGNEPAVGEGIRSALADKLCRREDVWITSKLWNTYHAPEHVRPACERTLRDLGVDYLDLYLVHFPIALAYVPMEDRYPPGWFFDPAKPELGMKSARVPLIETWRAMETLVAAGLVRNIGICNVGTVMLRELLISATIPPAVLQVELHPYLTQEKLLRFCRESGIAVTAFSPLGAPSYVPLGMASQSESVLADATVATIAERHARTPAQIVLRWGIQRGTAVVPKTANPKRLAENFALDDFTLSDNEMSAIAALNRNRRFNDPGDFCEAAFRTFFPIYE